MTSSGYSLANRPATGARLADYWELAKPEVSSLVVASTLVGFYMGAQGPIELALLFHTLVGTALVAGGTGAFNQYLEQADDARMRRTARRPLPAGRVGSRVAGLYATALSIGGVIYLALLSAPLVAWLALLTWGSYLLLYTPLKKRTPYCTLVGAFPGAMPPLIGWAAARGELGWESWLLYAILFFWQFPHFLSIAWLYREDYARAEIAMLPVVEPSGRGTVRQIVLCSLALLPVALVPSLVGMAGVFYFVGALLLTAGFLQVALQLARSRARRHAKYLLHASVAYLPLLFALMMLDKR